MLLREATSGKGDVIPAELSIGEQAKCVSANPSLGEILEGAKSRRWSFEQGLVVFFPGHIG